MRDDMIRGTAETLARKFASQSAEDDLRAAQVRHKRILKLAVAVLSLLAASTLLVGTQLLISNSLDIGEQLRWIGLVGAGVAVSIFAYLQTGSRYIPGVTGYVPVFSPGNSAKALMAQNERMQVMRSELNYMRKQLAEVSDKADAAREAASEISDEDRDGIVSVLKAQLIGDAAKEAVADLTAQAAAAYKRDARDAELRERFNESRGRLGQELHSLSIRGNVNLAIGAATSIVGLYFLGTGVLQELTAATTKDPWAFASHFLPRLTLVVFIELFAYFFLSLYRNSLQEIKYFQNELTNVESKQIALRTAIEYGDPATIASMVNSLAATERNHVLNRDQTTVELEKAKIDREGRGDVFKALQELIKKSKDKD
jgi:hypothetical protein